MNVVPFNSYRVNKQKKENELLMLNSELNHLFKLRDQVDFNISIMQEVITIVEEESCTKKDK